MLPICSPSGRCVRVEVDGDERWGGIDGDEIVLSDGVRIEEATASYLAPASPSKIIAVHLTYGSRVREYDARTPPELAPAPTDWPVTRLEKVVSIAL